MARHPSRHRYVLKGPEWRMFLAHAGITAKKLCDTAHLTPGRVYKTITNQNQPPALKLRRPEVDQLIVGAHILGMNIPLLWAALSPAPGTRTPGITQATVLDVVESFKVAEAHRKAKEVKAAKVSRKAKEAPPKTRRPPPGTAKETVVELHWLPEPASVQATQTITLDGVYKVHHITRGARGGMVVAVSKTQAEGGG